MTGPDRGGAPRAALIAVGTELVADGRIDTNGMAIARMLASVGFEAAWRLAVPDDPDLIACALRDAAERFPLVVVTGGLGPTVDDVTREGIERAFGLPLEQDDTVLEAIRARCARLGKPLNDASARQTLVPRGAEVIPNDAGSAPGLWLERPGGALLVVLPGVPHEMERMMEGRLLARLGARAGARSPLAARGMKASGLSEVEAQERVIDLFDTSGGRASLTLLASPGEITLIVRGRDASRVDAIFAQARARLGDCVFAEDAVTGLESAAGRALAARSLTLATAESCTGGLLGSLITRVPGSSRWYLQGWVTYSNAAKSSMLGVAPALIETHGAVSAEVADAMALGALCRSGAAVAASITGVAGPDGGTPDKPVGLVWISIAEAGAARSTRHLFPGDRDAIRLFAARTALNRIRLEAPSAEIGP